MKHVAPQHNFTQGLLQKKKNEAKEKKKLKNSSAATGCLFTEFD